MSKKLRLAIFMLIISVCPYIFIGMMFVPQAISFLEPVICPADMEMEVVHSTGYDRDGSYTRATIECTDGRNRVGATWKMFLIMFGVPLIGITLFLIISPTPEEPDRIIMNPNGIE